MLNLRKTSWTIHLVMGATLGFSSSAMAAQDLEINVFTAPHDPNSVQLAQITNVSELSDVLPSDWAYTALQRLVEEYGCLEGYPNRSFGGNRAMTRYEFAAGLNACLDVVVQLISGDAPTLDTLGRLQEEFALELDTIRSRIDTLESNVAELEANRFTTAATKLKGQLDTHLVVPFDAPDTENETTFAYRARFNFDTSFTGEDRLRVRIQASDRGGSGGTRALNQVAGGLSNQSFPRNGLEDNVGIDDLFYTFPVGERVSATVAAFGLTSSDLVTSIIVPFAAGPSVGFAGSPLFYSANDVDGVGGSFAASVNVALTDNLVLDLGYVTDENGPDSSLGIFDNYEYITQLNYLSDGAIDAAITYSNGEDDAKDGKAIFAGLLSVDLGDFVVAGYYADREDDANSWMAGIAAPDLLGTGNSAGVYYTQDFENNQVAELYYAMKINKYWSVTPALFYGEREANDFPSYYGVVRSTFKF